MHEMERHPPTPRGLAELGNFWWAFAVRGGFAVLFALALFCVGSLLGTILFDPVTLVMLALLLGFYVMGNGVLHGVATGFAIEHHDRIWRLLLAECLFAIGLGIYIGFSLFVSKDSLALLAGLYALGAGCLQIVLTVRLWSDKPYAVMLSVSGLIGIAAGAFFLLHRNLDVRSITHWLSAFELFHGCVILMLALELHRQHQRTLRAA